jgi:secreted PhoX family phosphatase
VTPNRREFLRTAGFASLAWLALPSRAARAAAELLPGPDGLLSLAPGFEARVIARAGQIMSDGLFMPGNPDGSAAFPGPNGRVLLVRNHELVSAKVGRGPFGANLELLPKVALERLYDVGSDGRTPQPGGTTTLVYDPATGQVEASWLSLGGTARNCAGGTTPWGSWLTCEEFVTPALGGFARPHGYVFEVPATATPELHPARPLTALGRMNHEAAAVDPASGAVYLTEDRLDSLFYRFLPDVPGELAKGGRLQALRLRDGPRDTRNWPDGPKLPRRTPFRVEWVTLDDVDADADVLRLQGFVDKRAARFARGEGLWITRAGVFFSCTEGGPARRGQIFRYAPSEHEGQNGESARPGTLELFLENDAGSLMHHPDNLTLAPSGELFVCEDGKEPDGLVRVEPNGRMTVIARNTKDDGELAGACFAPDGKTLFVNLQQPGITLAITGPFRAA